MPTDSALGRFATRHSVSDRVHLRRALLPAGAYAALTSLFGRFPQTNFPRVVILVDNGVMPADEMMATITRPIEESDEGHPRRRPRSARPRGAARRRSTSSSTGRSTWSSRSSMSWAGCPRSAPRCPSTAEAEVYRRDLLRLPHHRRQPHQSASGTSPSSGRSPATSSSRASSRSPASPGWTSWAAGRPNTISSSIRSACGRPASPCRRSPRP